MPEGSLKIKIQLKSSEKRYKFHNIDVEPGTSIADACIFSGIDEPSNYSKGHPSDPQGEAADREAKERVDLSEMKAVLEAVAAERPLSVASSSQATSQSDAQQQKKGGEEAEEGPEAAEAEGGLGRHRARPFQSAAPRGEPSSRSPNDSNGKPIDEALAKSSASPLVPEGHGISAPQWAHRVGGRGGFRPEEHPAGHRTAQSGNADPPLRRRPPSAFSTFLNGQRQPFAPPPHNNRRAAPRPPPVRSGANHGPPRGDENLELPAARPPSAASNARGQRGRAVGRRCRFGLHGDLVRHAVIGGEDAEETDVAIGDAAQLADGRRSPAKWGARSKSRSKRPQRRRAAQQKAVVSSHSLSPPVLDSSLSPETDVPPPSPRLAPSRLLDRLARSDGSTMSSLQLQPMNVIAGRIAELRRKAKRPVRRLRKSRRAASSTSTTNSPDTSHSSALDHAQVERIEEILDGLLDYRVQPLERQNTALKVCLIALLFFSTTTISILLFIIWLLSCSGWSTRTGSSRLLYELSRVVPLSID
ncbi:hypothetical protein M3Y99_00727100 [Aphelenchoides fujianensis]|nr:hypothetical protein M3Y99_00727100 [Aphelenchoides fujianensis]